MDHLVRMGFGEEDSRNALAAAGGDTDRAIEVLLGQSQDDISAPAYALSPESLETEHADSERGVNEPGIITSGSNPEVGSLMTILNCNFWVQKKLSTAELNGPLEWEPEWTSSRTTQKPQGVLEELIKECAFVHMTSGRSRADAALLERAIGEGNYSSLGEYLELLKPLRPVFEFEINEKSQLNIKVDQVYTDLTAHVDKMLLGKDVTRIPPVILLEVEQATDLWIEEFWYPQRSTNELSPLNTKARLVLNTLDERLSKIRRKRFDLRAFKGSDVVEMLKAASKTMQEYKSPKSAETLDQLVDKLGSERNHLMDEQQIVGDERRTLDVLYQNLDPQLFEKLGVDPIPIWKYTATGVLINSTEYYTRYDNQWFYVRDEMPSVCSFNTVKDACHDQSELLVVYSRTPDVDELEPSQAIKEFCIQELEFLENQHSKQLDSKLNGTSDSVATSDESTDEYTDAENNPNLHPR